MIRDLNLNTMQSGLFECSICYNNYNDSKYCIILILFVDVNKPLALHCGHVYC